MAPKLQFAVVTVLAAVVGIALHGCGGVMTKVLEQVCQVQTGDLIGKLKEDAMKELNSFCKGEASGDKEEATGDKEDTPAKDRRLVAISVCHDDAAKEDALKNVTGQENTLVKDCVDEFTNLTDSIMSKPDDAKAKIEEWLNTKKDALTKMKDDAVSKAEKKVGSLKSDKGENAASDEEEPEPEP